MHTIRFYLTQFCALVRHAFEVSCRTDAEIDAEIDKRGGW